MDVLINSDCCFIPDKSELLSSQGSTLLNFLAVLNYDQHSPPAADLLRQYHHLSGEWVLVSPVRWEATHNDAFIVATAKELNLGEAESKFLFELYAKYLAEEGMTLYYHTAEIWLLFVSNKPSLSAKPVHRLLNKSLAPELTQLDRTLYWQKFITESQMFFASQAEKSRVNGLWLWGGGTQLLDKKAINICADEHFLPLAQIISPKATLYSAATVLQDIQVLLLSNFDSLCEEHKEDIKKMPVNWYWNNSAYTQANRNWLARLWRTLIHAH